MNDPCVIEPRGLQREVQRFRDVADLHCRAELPGDDVTREVIQDRAEILSASANRLFRSTSRDFAVATW